MLHLISSTQALVALAYLDIRLGPEELRDTEEHTSYFLNMAKNICHQLKAEVPHLIPRRRVGLILTWLVGPTEHRCVLALLADDFASGCDDGSCHICTYPVASFILRSAIYSHILAHNHVCTEISSVWMIRPITRSIRSMPETRSSCQSHRELWRKSLILGVSCCRSSSVQDLFLCGEAWCLVI